MLRSLGLPTVSRCRRPAAGFAGRSMDPRVPQGRGDAAVALQAPSGRHCGGGQGRSAASISVLSRCRRRQALRPPRRCGRAASVQRQDWRESADVIVLLLTQSRCRRPAAGFAGGDQDRPRQSHLFVALQAPSGRLCGGCSEAGLDNTTDRRDALIVALQAPSGRLCGSLLQFGMSVLTGVALQAPSGRLCGSAR